MGASFEDVNRLVFTYLEKLARAGNGRQAFLDLDSQFTRGAYKTLLITKAWNT
jgi:hypothetical protein